MEPQHSSRKLTYEDYVHLPEDNLRHEIIGGEHFVTASPVTRHQRISREIVFLIRQYLENDPRGEVFDAPFDVLLSDFDIVVPDVLYLSRERARLLTPQNLQGPPDLVVEILSPSTRARDEHLKRDLYERAGVKEYWLVDPERDSVTVHRRGSGDFGAPELFSKSDVLTTPLLPGLAIPLARVLA